jgi:hypothetical protein
MKGPIWLTLALPVGGLPSTDCINVDAITDQNSLLAHDAGGLVEPGSTNW